MSGKKIEYQGNSYEMIKLLAQEYEVEIGRAHV